MIDLNDCPEDPGPLRPCLGLENFAGQYGDIVIIVENLFKTCCGEDGKADILYSTTTCDYDSPTSCIIDNRLDTQYVSKKQTVHTSIGGIPNLSIAPSSNSGIKICKKEDPFDLEFLVCNTSSVDAYEVGIEFDNNYGLQCL